MHGELIAKLRYVVENPSAWEAFDQHISDLIAEAVAALSGQGQAPVGVKVKPLEWDEHGRAGDYVICETCGQGPKPFMLTRGMKIIDYFDDEEAPKPIAQADYERRILSALDLPAPEAAETANGPVPSSLSMADGVIHAAYDRDEDARAAYDALEAGRLPAPVTAGDVERAVEADRGDAMEAFRHPERLPHLAPAQGEAVEDHCCPICAEPFSNDDLCASDVEMGTCHAACLEGSTVVDLETGEPSDGSAATYRYGSGWRIDRTTGSPILVYDDCSVIQDEQADYVLRLIRQDKSPSPAGTVAAGAVERPSYAQIIDLVASCRDRQQKAAESDRMLSKWISEGLNAALRAKPAGAPEEWRSMDSAPRDGTRFLALQGDRHFDCWWYDKGYGEAYWMDEADSEPEPTHWMPLPASPPQGERAAPSQGEGDA